MEKPSTETFRSTDRALAALRAAGLDPARTFVALQHVLGCGGAGYRLVSRETPLEDGALLEGPEGLRISLDAYSRHRLEGAALDYDLEKETEGFRLDHPDAAFVAFC